MSYKPVVGASTLASGVIRLAGDLSGTSTSPTVPSMARVNMGGLESIYTNAAATGPITLNLTDGNVFSLTLVGNVTIAFSGATAGKSCSLAVYLKQDATGSRNVTWPASAKWSGGAPTLSTIANAVDIVVFESIDGGTNWYGSLVGVAFA